MAVTEPRLAAPDPERFLGAAITAAAPEPPGPVRISAARYRSAEFAAVENERLWPRVWKIAGSVDHVADRHAGSSHTHIPGGR